MSSYTELGSGMRLPNADSLTIKPPTDAEKRSAAIEVCSRATDVEDAAELLAMLGLVES